MRVVAWFQILVGVAVAALWTVLLSTGQVPEVQDGRVDIWFHVTAEVVMAALLFTAGVAVLRRAGAGSLLSGLALGWLGYSAVDSGGYYAEADEWVAVAMFALLLTAVAGAFAQLRSRDARRELPTQSREPETLPQVESVATGTRGHR